MSEANAWQQLFPSGSPPSARWLHTAVWGSSRLYIFAGESINGINPSVQQNKSDAEVVHGWVASEAVSMICIPTAVRPLALPEHKCTQAAAAHQSDVNPILSQVACL